MWVLVLVIALISTALSQTPAEPAQPAPSEAVKKLFDEANKLSSTRDNQGALAAADRALSLAKETSDTVGEVRAHRGRAIFLDRLGKLAESVAEWKETAAGWERIGDGPGGIEALATAGRLLLQSDPRQSDQLFEQALLVLRQEKQRPLAAAVATKDAGSQIFDRNLEWADKMYQAAYDITNKLRPDSEDSAIILNHLGRVASRRDNLSAAANYVQQALDIEEKLRPDSLSVALALNNLGLIASSGKALEKAAEYHHKALAIRERLAPGSLAVAQSLQLLGDVELEKGNLDGATDYYNRALAIYQKRAPVSGDVASIFDHLAAMAADRNQLAKATEYYQQALLISEKLAPDSLDVAISLHHLGQMAHQQGDLNTAAEDYQRALAIKEKLAPNSLALADILNDLGVVLQDQGQIQAATERYQRALRIRKKLAPDSLDVAETLISLGGVAREQGDLASAVDYLLLAHAIEQKFPSNSLNEARLLSDLGAVANDRGNLDSAGEYISRSFEIIEKIAPDSLEAADCLTALGVVALKKGDLDAAAKNEHRALEIKQKLAPNSRTVASTLNNLGVISDQQGHQGAALQHFQRALAIEERLAPDSVLMVQTLSGLAAVAAETGDLAGAEAFATRAWRIMQQRGALVTGDEARQAFGVSSQDYAGLLLGIQLQRGEPEAAFRTLEEGRAQALARLLFERNGMLSSAAGDLWPRQQEALAKLHHLEETLTKLMRMPNSPEVQQRQVDVLRDYQDAKDAADQVWAEIQKRQPRAFVPTLNVAEAFASLGTDAMFVAFSLQENSGFVFSLRNHTVVAKKLAPPASPDKPNLATLVLDYWQRTRTPPPSDPQTLKRSQAERISEGRELFDELFPGEIGEQVRKSTRLLLSPDLYLWQLPFAALVMDADADGTPHYLGERVAIGYTPSLALYAQSKKESPQFKKGGRVNALVTGDPDFEHKIETDPTDPDAWRVWAGLYPAGSRPERLRSTLQEASLIARLYGSEPLTQAKATEAELRKRIETADVIHLATHGVLRTGLPMSSGLVLTPPGKQPAIGETNNDGALQAWEIFSQLTLRAELVVLSACDTARGDLVRGEGIVGLTRALQYAGARSIVATQWSVAEGESTARLMEMFHENLRKGKPKDQALKDAMDETRKKYPHPFFWAPFMLLGDPDNPNLKAN